uniref:Uncharacterized protein n=1 Tax=viral metagenome TaxID=1070528 RepID=A0A6C0J429_9ZZZZ
MFVKWINPNICNRNLQLKLGLNTHTIPSSMEGDCVPGEFIIAMLKMSYHGSI